MLDIAKLCDLLRVALHQVFRQRRRYFGVVLAISIGTAGFIVVFNVGRNVKANLNRDLDLLGGATRIKVTLDYRQSSRDVVPKPRWFRQEAIEAVRRLPGVSQVSLVAVKTALAHSHVSGREHGFMLLAVDQFFWDVNSFFPVNGHFFGAEAVERRLRVCVLGHELARRIFGRTDVEGRTMSLDRDLYLVTGVLGGVGIADRAGFAFIPLTTGTDRIQGLRLPDHLYVRCRTWDDVDAVAAAIPGVMETYQPSDSVELEVAWEQLKKVQRIALWMEIFVYLSIGATMLLGGLGIWNGMMAAVQARTREIGLKKAIGAEDGDVMIQFLGEALFLSLGSMVLGIVLGRAGVKVINGMLRCPTEEHLFIVSVVLTIVFSTLLGLGAGFIPSMRASRMEVVDAMRYE